MAESSYDCSESSVPFIYGKQSVHYQPDRRHFASFLFLGIVDSRRVSPYEAVMPIDRPLSALDTGGGNTLQKAEAGWLRMPEA